MTEDLVNRTVQNNSRLGKSDNTIRHSSYQKPVGLAWKYIKYKNSVL